MARRWLAAATVSLGVILGGAAPGLAADPVTVSLTDIHSAKGKVTGSLTLRSKSAVRVDPASVSATIDNVAVPVRVQQAAAVERRAILLIDTSGSMGIDGMSTVRRATSSYLKAVPDDVKVGVVSFANTAGVDIAPTTNRAAVQRVVNGLASRGDTSLYAGVQSAIKALGGAGDRSVVLLSDGADTVASNRVAAQGSATRALKADGIRVDVVRFRSTDPDAGLALKGFADANGGSVTSADDTSAVVAAFETSAKALESQVRFELTPPATLTGPHRVVLKGVAGGTPFTVAKDVAMAPAAPVPSTAPTPAATPGVPAAALPAFTLTATRSWFPLMAAGVLALGLFGLAASTLTPSFETKRERRVGSIEQYVVGSRTLSRSENKEQPTPLKDQLNALGERAMKGRKYSSWVAAKIETADLPFRLGDWFVLSVTAAGIGAALGYIVSRSEPLAGVMLGFVIGAVVPQLVLRFLANRRAKQFEAILPDVLMLVATSLRSGFGLPQALDAVARDAGEPAAKEFSRALAETRIGTEVPDALEHAAERMNSKSLLWTIMAIRIQRDVGGNLADTLLTTATTLRERESLHRQVRALSAEGRLSAWILIAIPLFLFMFMFFSNHEYISLLWTRPLGILMIVVSVVMMVAGSFWMSRLVKVEV